MTCAALLRESLALILADAGGAGELDNGSGCSGDDAGGEDDVGDGGEGGEWVVLGGLEVDVLWIVAHRSAVARRRERRSLDTPRTFNFWR